MWGGGGKIIKKILTKSHPFVIRLVILVIEKDLGSFSTQWMHPFVEAGIKQKSDWFYSMMKSDLKQAIKSDSMPYKFTNVIKNFITSKILNLNMLKVFNL